MKRIKSTCNGCKALWYHAKRNVGVCVLDHEITEVMNGVYRPWELCSKPKTKQQLAECLLNAEKITPK